jgi:hypothetical protein
MRTLPAALFRAARAGPNRNGFVNPSLVDGTDPLATVPERQAQHWAAMLEVVPMPLEVAGFSVPMGWASAKKMLTDTCTWRLRLCVFKD